MFYLAADFSRLTIFSIYSAQIIFPPPNIHLPNRVWYIGYRIFDECDTHFHAGEPGKEYNIERSDVRIMNQLGGNEMKKFTIILWSAVIAFSGIAGYASIVHASHNDRYSYTFYNGYTSGNTAMRAKYTDNVVYINQVSGPSVKYSVQGSKTGATWHSRSYQLTLHSGYHGLIENSVNESGDRKARLHLVRTTKAYTNTIGYWDPDPV